MFKSRRRDIVIPQSEHQKLAGTLALLWGNAQFELPPLPHLSVVAGIADHDRAYGCLDNYSIGEVNDSQWLQIARRGFTMAGSDPVADLVIKHHILRLVSGMDTPPHQSLASEMRGSIQEQIDQNGFDPEIFVQLDRMANLCDRVSFDFCLEEPSEGQVEVFTQYETATPQVVRYKIDGSEITLDPWPLKVTPYTGYLLGYQGKDYPDILDSVIVPYHIQPLLA